MTEGVGLWLWRHDNDQQMWWSFKKVTRYLKRNRVIKMIAGSWWSPQPDFSPKERLPARQRWRNSQDPPRQTALGDHLTWVRMLPIEVPDKGRVQNLTMKNPTVLQPSQSSRSLRPHLNWQWLCLHVHKCSGSYQVLEIFHFCVQACKVISRFHCPLSAPFWEAWFW